MKYIIEANNEPVAEATGFTIDETMGVQNGKYFPLEGYKEIEKKIKAYSKLAFELNMDDAKDKKEFLSIIKEIDTFDIKIFDDTGVTVECGKIDLRDYSDDLGDEGYDVTIYP
jgi:hypothetical protein